MTDSKPDSELLHAGVWLERYPGWWERKAELAHDPDELVAGTDLLDFFAAKAVRELYLRDGTNLRITRSDRIMKDYIVRADMAWTLAPLREYA